MNSIVPAVESIHGINLYGIVLVSPGRLPKVIQLIYTICYTAAISILMVWYMFMILELSLLKAVYILSICLCVHISKYICILLFIVCV